MIKENPFKPHPFHGVFVRHQLGQVVCLPKPNRHYHCMRILSEVASEPLRTDPHKDQGFYYMDGDNVVLMGRDEAQSLIYKNWDWDGRDLINSAVLTSEDLW